MERLRKTTNKRIIVFRTKFDPEIFLREIRRVTSWATLFGDTVSRDVFVSDFAKEPDGLVRRPGVSDTLCTVSYRGCVKQTNKQTNLFMTIMSGPTVFWDRTPCIPIEIHQHSGGTCCIHLQGEITAQTGNQKDVSSKFYGLLFGLIFEPENGGTAFL
jgi:hypothetical protein